MRQYLLMCCGRDPIDLGRRPKQSHQNLSTPKGLGYVINVANEKNGIGYGAWNHIDGWSEGVIDYILETEAFDKELA